MSKLSFKIGIGYVIMVAVVILVSLGAVNANRQAQKEMELVAKEIAPQIDAAMEIKLTLTEAHLWFEEVMSGAEPMDVIYEVYAKINEAQSFAQALVSGGSNNEGDFYPLHSEADRLIAEKAVADIDTFRTLTEERYSRKLDGQGGDDELDAQFDSIMRY